MNPIRTGRTVLFVLPYILFLAGIVVAGKVAPQAGGGHVAMQALGVAAVGALWAAVRNWRRSRSHRSR